MLTRCVPSALRFARAFATGRGPPPKKLLRPYDLAQQLRQLAEGGNVNAAVERLRSVPSDAQNVPTWNTMLSLCMAHNKYQLAYTLFIDMKRRGFSPNISTFATMLKGLSQITDWEKYSKQLANAHALYGYYLQHVESIKHHDPHNVTQLSVAPLVIYISILGAACDLQRMFEVYFAMDQEGPNAPDRFVFTAMLRAIAHFNERAGVTSVGGGHASDAKHVWLQIEKTMQKRPDFKLDSHLIAATLQALARGRPTDQDLALDLAAQHLGLTRPDHPGPFVPSPHLNHWTLDAALQVCLAAQQYGLCVHFMRLVMDNLDFDRPDGRSLVVKSHIYKLLRAHAALAMQGSPLESSRAVDTLEWCLKNDVVDDMGVGTYHLVLLTCFRAGDWDGAIKSYELMTGVQVGSFDESKLEVPPRVRKQSERRNLVPNAETMALVLRTALKTGDETKCLQAMWLTEHAGAEGLLRNESVGRYYRASFARVLVIVVDRLLDDSRTEPHRKRFVSLKTRAEEVARTLGDTSSKLTADDLTTLTEEDRVVAFDLAARSSKPRRN